jgi:aspartyl/asparaginyl beta-hydroxylase (cupin superfamily)
MPAVHDPASFPFVPRLEAAWASIRAELLALGSDAFAPSPDSLTTVADGYDETGWYWYGLFGADAALAAHRVRCPATAAACAPVPGLVNAGFSLLRPGTHLYPHQGELQGVLRCHLPLVMPAGDLGLRLGERVLRWHAGRCLVFDDTFEHDAWNRGDGDRIVLLVTFAPLAARPAPPA